MLTKNFKEKSGQREDLMISNIFARDKPDGSVRIILDQSKFNEHVTYRHFKMDLLQTAVNLISKDCYMASID